MNFLFRKSKTIQDLPTLSASEAELVNELNFSKALAIAIKSKAGAQVQALHEVQWLEEYDHEPLIKGIKCKVDKDLSMPGLYSRIRSLQADERFPDYHIFSFGNYTIDKAYFIGALKTNDQYEILSVLETNGINYNITTDDIIEFLKRWHQLAPFKIIDADHDRVVMQFAHIEFDLFGFAQASIKICPDFGVEIEDPKHIKKYIVERRGEVEFWWD